MTTLSDWATWREIHAQPAIWQRFGAQLEQTAPNHRAWITENNPDSIWLSGAGTSAYIGDFVAAALNSQSKIPLASVASTDLVAAPHQFLRSNQTPLVINFGRSGNSTESVGVLNTLDTLAPNAPRLNITCNPSGTLATRTSVNQKVVNLPEDTHDNGFAMTSSYSTMLLTALSLLDPSPPENPWPRLATALETALPEYELWANDMPTPNRIVITGSGALRFAAREAALKIMELTAGRIPVLWDTSLGFRHGPKSFVAPNTHIICMMSSDPEISRYDSDLSTELKSQFQDVTVTELPPPPLNDTWGAVVQVAAAQVLSVILSDRMGLNVDDPFQGQGTLTRVVDGVTLYPPATS